MRAEAPSWFVLASSSGLVCPSCPTTDRVRCIVFGDGFWTNLGIGLLPFAVMVAVTMFVHRLAAVMPAPERPCPTP